MTITLERPVSPVCDSKLANDIRHLVDNLDTNIYDIVKDYQEIFCCEVILIDDNKNHCQIEIHDTGEIEMLQQGYSPSGELFHISLDSITTLPQFTALIQRTENSSDQSLEPIFVQKNSKMNAVCFPTVFRLHCVNK